MNHKHLLFFALVGILVLSSACTSATQPPVPTATLTPTLDPGPLQTQTAQAALVEKNQHTTQSMLQTQAPTATDIAIKTQFAVNRQATSEQQTLNYHATATAMA